MVIDDPKEEEHYFKVGNSSKNSWYLHSECSRHIIGDKSYFIKLKPKSGELTFGDNSKGQIEGIGSISKKNSTFIENILYVNNLKHNLLIISQLCDKERTLVVEMSIHVVFYDSNLPPRKDSCIDDYDA
ncbi:hypothetical protein V6Z12_D01G219900 [Gossypium hirsutum]